MRRTRANEPIARPSGMLIAEPKKKPRAMRCRLTLAFSHTRAVLGEFDGLDDYASRWRKAPS
jgi:hypothetical protein